MLGSKVRITPHPLIYDWNQTDGPSPASPVLLDDETLRDGLQSPSVRTPPIGDKIRILHLIDALGIDTADIGLPGAGAHVVEDVERLAREIVSARLRVRANCARSHAVPHSGQRALSMPRRSYPHSGQKISIPSLNWRRRM